MENKKKGGFGVVYQDVTRNKNISAAAKGLYAYLSSFCGIDDECYPSVETIVREMGIGKDTFYRHINALVAAGVVEKQQIVNTCGQFWRTIYRLTHEVKVIDLPDTGKSSFSDTGKSDFPFPKNADTDKPEAAHKETNNNNINNNSINNNNSIISPEPKKEIKLSDILLPLNDGSFYNVPEDKIEIWKQAYPAVDIIHELKKMISWLESNPSRKKTKQGIARFINTWLSKEQDKGGSYRQQDTAARPSHKQHYDVPECPDGPFQ